MASDKAKFVDFLRGCHQPKLNWVVAQLILLQVPHRINGVSVNGPILQVAEGEIEKAHTVLTTVVGMMNLAGALTDDTIKVMDLVDTHPLFESDLDLEDLPAQGTEPLATPPVVPTPEPDTNAAIAQVLAEDEDDDPFALPDDDIPEAPVPELIAAELATPQPLTLVPDSLADVTATDDKIEDLVGAVEETFEVPAPEDVVPDDEDDDPFAEDTDDDELWATDEEPPDEHPELDYLRAKKVLQHSETQFAGVDGTVDMYEVNSSNVSKVGARISQKVPENCTFYALFKGGTQPYRYGPVTVVKFNDIMSEAVRAAEGRPEASVGSLYHHLVKVDAEAGTIKCQRLVEGRWVEVLPKSQRTKAAKDKHKG